LTRFLAWLPLSVASRAQGLCRGSPSTAGLATKPSLQAPSCYPNPRRAATPQRPTSRKGPPSCGHSSTCRWFDPRQVITWADVSHSGAASSPEAFRWHRNLGSGDASESVRLMRCLLSRSPEREVHATDEEPLRDLDEQDCSMTRSWSPYPQEIGAPAQRPELVGERTGKSGDSTSNRPRVERAPLAGSAGGARSKHRPCRRFSGPVPGS